MTDITLPPMPQGVPYQESVLVAYARAAMKLNAPQWQPIETAPKDGRPVLGIHHGSSRAFEMYRGPHGWWLDTKDRRRDPSYWMPMPPPPDHFRDATKMVSAASAEPARMSNDFSLPNALWEAAQLAKGEFIADAIIRIRALLERYGQHQPVGSADQLPDQSSGNSRALNEREAFEYWAQSRATLRRNNAGYSSGITHLAWCAWQARAALAQKEADHG